MVGRRARQDQEHFWAHGKCSWAEAEFTAQALPAEAGRCRLPLNVGGVQSQRLWMAANATTPVVFVRETEMASVVPSCIATLFAFQQVSCVFVAPCSDVAAAPLLRS
jgi:hypothetical protein